MMAQQVPTGMLTLNLPADATVAAAKAQLQRRYPRLEWPKGTLLAVNQEYAGEQTVLRDGDEVAVIPPVSGG
jgi:molybdopterin converting factor subunit 1